jgi:hypothetical protein
MEISIDSLFQKIGVLTVENDLLKSELNQAKAYIEQLREDARPHDEPQPEAKKANKE